MKRIRPSDISQNPDRQLGEIMAEDLMPLPGDCQGRNPGFAPLAGEQKKTYECSLDGVSVAGISRPRTREEEKRLVDSFLDGLRRLLSQQDNWTFWQQLTLSLDSCVQCQTCGDACAIYLSSGRQEIYRPTFRSEVLRRIKRKYLDRGGKFLASFRGNDIELNWTTIARLAESAYRCTMCRRCAQWCPMGCDNGLITRELRKLFSQQMGIAAKELHTMGTVQQLKLGATTGMTPRAFKNVIQFMEDEITDKTGRKITIPVDREGADILFIHNTGECLSWPENPEAFAIIFEAAGLSWTLSSEPGGYEVANYGVWYDDVQFSRIIMKQIEIARKLKVKKIVIGECGHSHKALIVIADRILTDETNIPRESYLPILLEIVNSGRINLDPGRNNFPVTLHDPCNIVRLMGIVEPQRKILKKICPQFREMTPHGPDNYCCGGGSGFAIMSSMNFLDWRASIAGRMKVKQCLEAFSDVPTPDVKKYVCAPCSNCKGQIRDIFDYYNLWEKHGILYGGLVELVVNAMADIKEPFIRWEWR